MCNAVKRFNPKIKGHPGDFAIARNDLDNAWKSLRKMYEKEDDPVEALIDRLQAEKYIEMIAGQYLGRIMQTTRSYA
jgi:hypothetical protein